MKVPTSPMPKAPAFARADLLAIVAALLVLGTLALPVLANHRSQSDRAVCWNNLRLLGRGFHQWGSDHGERLPWVVPASEGGTSPKSNPLANNTWFHFAVFSNELSTPRILACPSDASRRPANQWSVSPEGGFLHPTYRNCAVSYLLSVDGDPGLNQQLALSADRNIQHSGVISSCSLGFTTAFALNPRASTTGWKADLHGLSGNVLLRDGQVRSTTSTGLRSLLWNDDDNGTFHLLLP